jgi:signal transduction histidine kinase
MTVCVSDDGTGVGESTRRSGLANIRRRAERRGGAFTVEDLAPGTRLTWTASVS